MQQAIRITQAFSYQQGWRQFPTDAFDVKIAGKHQWLKRMLWAALKKMGCVSTHFDREELCHSMILDPDKVSALILATAEAQFEQMYRGKRPTRVFIGIKDFADLMNDPEIIKYSSFSFRINESQQLMGMEVEVVPHMSGILVV